MQPKSVFHELPPTGIFDRPMDPAFQSDFPDDHPLLPQPIAAEDLGATAIGLAEWQNPYGNLLQAD
tara:strand:- start:38600 stop:38797 length:198 start_codon:yes stop_codon:yes gene_type:complete